MSCPTLLVSVGLASIPCGRRASVRCVTSPACCESGSGTAGGPMAAPFAPAHAPVWVTVLGGRSESYELAPDGGGGWAGDVAGVRVAVSGRRLVPPAGWRWVQARSNASPPLVEGRLEGPAGERMRIMVTL